jgi:hypothetical protein
MLGMALLWAKDLGEIAACWDLGVAANTILFAVFAAVAIRGVRGRWENLGGDRPTVPAPASTPGVSRKDPQEEAMEMLFYLARRQQNKSLQWPELPACRTTGRDRARNCYQLCRNRLQRSR